MHYRTTVPCQRKLLLADALGVLLFMSAPLDVQAHTQTIFSVRNHVPAALMFLVCAAFGFAWTVGFLLLLSGPRIYR